MFANPCPPLKIFCTPPEKILCTSLDETIIVNDRRAKRAAKFLKSWVGFLFQNLPFRWMEHRWVLSTFLAEQKGGGGTIPKRGGPGPQGPPLVSSSLTSSHTGIEGWNEGPNSWEKSGRPFCHRTCTLAKHNRKNVSFSHPLCSLLFEVLPARPAPGLDWTVYLGEGCNIFTPRPLCPPALGLYAPWDVFFFSRSPHPQGIRPHGQKAFQILQLNFHLTCGPDYEAFFQRYFSKSSVKTMDPWWKQIAHSSNPVDPRNSKIAFLDSAGSSSRENQLSRFESA